MPNLITTYNCNRNCSFCFVDKHSDPIDYTVNTLIDQYPFINSFNRIPVSLVGGEPSLNPEFITLIKWLTVLGHEVHVFTNGKIDSVVLTRLKTLDLSKVSFWVNRSDTGRSENVLDFYRALGYSIHLSVTVFREGQNLEYIIDEILNYSLLKTFRLGIALPVYNTQINSYLKPESYKAVARDFISFIKVCLKNHIKPVFDCGFPFCFFDEEQKLFLKQNDIFFASNCGIIPDINAQNELIPCFPLSRLKLSFKNIDIWKDKEQELTRTLQEMPKVSLFDDCLLCNEIAAGNCSGGCLSFRLATG